MSRRKDRLLTSLQDMRQSFETELGRLIEEVESGNATKEVKKRAKRLKKTLKSLG